MGFKKNNRRGTSEVVDQGTTRESKRDTRTDAKVEKYQAKTDYKQTKSDNRNEKLQIKVDKINARAGCLKWLAILIGTAMAAGSFVKFVLLK